jgi:DNA-directed RNA polymerase subunit RPC12/RpoP
MSDGHDLVHGYTCCGIDTEYCLSCQKIVYSTNIVELPDGTMTWMCTDCAAKVLKKIRNSAAVLTDCTA